MTPYRLARMTNRANISLPGSEASAMNEAALLKVLRSILREIAAFARETIVLGYKQRLAERRASLRDSVGTEQSALRAIIARLAAAARYLIVPIIRAEARFQDRAWRRTVKRRMGVDIGSMIRDEDLSSLLDGIVGRNIALIDGLTTSAQSAIANSVTRAYSQGKPVATLRKELSSQFRSLDKRAQLIARDQMSKVTSEVTQLRHQQAGITQFIWRTSRDERVRSRHRKLEGKTYTYGKPTGAEQGLPPGQPIRCRCTAEAIVT